MLQKLTELDMFQCFCMFDWFDWFGNRESIELISSSPNSARQNRIRMDQAEWTSGRRWMCQWKWKFRKSL